MRRKELCLFWLFPKNFHFDEMRKNNRWIFPHYFEFKLLTLKNRSDLVCVLQNIEHIDQNKEQNVEILGEVSGRKWECRGVQENIVLRKGKYSVFFKIFQKYFLILKEEYFNSIFISKAINIVIDLNYSSKY